MLEEWNMATILWPVDPVLGNNHEIRDYATAVAK
jgi:hypothetical protein